MLVVKEVKYRVDLMNNANRNGINGLGSAAVCDCGTPWTFLLPFSHTTPVVFVPCGDPRKSPRTFI